jgi:Uncharacterised protein conserved in bacteria (DUF2313)
VGLAESYARMMKALLPPGKLWKLVGSKLEDVFLGASDELVRLHGRTQDLLAESDPRQATELLPEFEAMLALTPSGTLAERRARVVARLVRRQRFRPVDFQTVLAPLLGQAAGDVVVIERGRAFAILVANDREIYRFYIYRDPSAPGTYDLAGAQAMVDAMKPSHTVGKVIESVSFKCDDPHSLCNRDLLGA